MDLANIVLEDLIISLQTHEIDIDEDERKKKIKFIAFKSLEED